MSASPSGGRMRCPTCAAAFRTGWDFCPGDGSPLAPWTDANDPLIGVEIAGRYVIEERVGEGSTGLIYRARHIHLLRQFAVKILFGDLVSDPRMRLRFAQEAALASQLNHPHVVSVVDFGRSDQGLLYLVMDYVQGTPLSEVMRAESPFDPLRAVRLARQLACGLGHAHEYGMVHRDFKPGNVILEQRGDGPTMPRIVDFGLAVSTREIKGESPDRLTESGFVVGTPVYIAPEQMLDHPVDRRTDLFAFGVVLYEMLAGKPPFDGSSTEIAHKNLTWPVEPIGCRSPGVDVPPELERLVFRLVEKNPKDRPGSADEVCAALDEIERQVEGTRTRLDLPARTQSAEWSGDLVTPPVMPLSAPSRALVRARLATHRWRWVSAAGACVLAAGALAYAAMHRSGVTDAARAQARAAPPVVGSNGPSMVRPSPPPIPVVSKLPVHDRPAASSSEPSSEPSVDPPPPPPRRAVVRRDRPAHRPARAARTQERTQESAAGSDSDADPFPYKDDPYMDGSVVEFIREYKEVGEAITRLQGTRGEPAARAYRERYRRLRYAEALRVQAVRRDARAELSELRRDVLAALGRASPRSPARADDPYGPDAESIAVDRDATREPAGDGTVVSVSPSTL